MAKKSFKGENPALRYMSVTTTDNVQHEQDAQYTHETQNENNAHIVENAQYTDENKNPDGQCKKAGKETKSKRLNVLIRPSLFEDASKIAHMQRISVNELIHLAVEKYVIENEEEVTKYDTVYGEK